MNIDIAKISIGKFITQKQTFEYVYFVMSFSNRYGMKHFLRYGKAVGEFEWNFPAEYPQPL